MPIKPLKLLSTKIFSGAPLYSVTKLIENADGVPLLNIKDIIDGQIAINNCSLFSLANFKNAERYLVYPGDVLITCRGTQLKIAVVPVDIKKSLITTNLIAVRLTNQISPIFLAAYLKTTEGQKALLANTASSTMQFALNVSDINEIDVPVPPLSLQEKIVNLADNAEEQCRLGAEIANLRQAVVNQVIIDVLAKYEEEKREKIDL